MKTAEEILRERFPKTPSKSKLAKDMMKAMVEYTQQFIQNRAKNLQQPVVMPSLPDGLVEGSNCDNNYKKGWEDCWNKFKGQ